MAELAPDDERLVGGLLRGEASAVELLVDRYGGRVHRVARRLLCDRRDAEEVTQHALMTVVQKIGTFKSRLHRARLFLRRELASLFGPPR